MPSCSRGSTWTGWRRWPGCTAGQGGSPVEDSAPEREGGPYPTAPFLIDDVNDRLILRFSSN